jgi:serine/threonine protein phosphatase 1
MRTHHTEWRPLPVSTGPNHLFAIGDIHGHLDVMQAALGVIHEIPKRGKASELVLLGDLNDRGPDSFGCMRLGLDGAAEAAGVDSHVYLPGNHEILMLMCQEDDDAAGTWLYPGNGGMDVYRDMGFPKDLNGALNRELGEGYREKIFGRNHYRAGDLLLVHAGIDPRMSLDECLMTPIIGNTTSVPWAWVRDPFLTHEGPWNAMDSLLVVHGHTSLRRDPGSSAYKADKYQHQVSADECDMVEARRRINLDTGCASNKVVGVAEFFDDRYRIHVVDLSSLTI